MSLANLFNEPEWDKPFFKRLAHNDTGAAQGHQGGMVIPKVLRPFLPGLIGTPTAAQPTIEAIISADLYLEDQHVAIVETRYQMQTWRGTRSPETRITRNLGPIRDEARENDVLVLQRSLSELSRYRLILVRRETDAFANELRPLIGNRRLGLIDTGETPLTETALRRAQTEQTNRQGRTFQLFDTQTRTTETRVTRIARSQAFRDAVKAAYNNQCCVCGIGVIAPSGLSEVEGAHIAPRYLGGADDVRNGLCFCRTHHWAFDRGLFSIEDDGRITVPNAVRAMQQNNTLAAFNGRMIHQANAASRPHPSALSWHRQHRLIRWL